jgi:hypothetical protein
LKTPPINANVHGNPRSLKTPPINANVHGNPRSLKTPPINANVHGNPRGVTPPIKSKGQGQAATGRHVQWRRHCLHASCATGARHAAVNTRALNVAYGPLRRPLTDSELTFLKYIRQWRKKVVFVVNKVDLLETQEEVDTLLGERGQQQAWMTPEPSLSAD